MTAEAKINTINTSKTRQRELIGLTAIGNYLGVAATTVLRLQATAGLLLYKRRLQRVKPGCRGWAWSTTPELLTLWQVSRCAADRAENPKPTRTRRKADADDDAASQRRARVGS